MSTGLSAGEMTNLVSVLFIAMIPIDCKITNFPYSCLFTIFIKIIKLVDSQAPLQKKEFICQ